MMAVVGRRRRQADIDNDLVLVREVGGVPDQKLERVFACRQGQVALRPAPL